MLQQKVVELIKPNNDKLQIMVGDCEMRTYQNLKPILLYFEL
jgi:fructose-1-phosphate kinase PfkB-like protein